MLPVSENQVLPLAEGLGFTVVRFEDGDIRIDPPTPFLGSIRVSQFRLVTL